MQGSPSDPIHTVSDPTMHWTTSNLGEAMPGVMTPLTWTMWDHALNHAVREAGFAMGALSRKERRTLPASVSVFYGRAAARAESFALLGDRMPGTTGRAAVESLFGPAPDMSFAPTKRRYPFVALMFPASFASVPRRLRRLAPRYDEWWRASVDQVPTLDMDGSIAMIVTAKERLEVAVVEQGRTAVIGIQPVYDVLSRLVSRLGAGDISKLSAPSGAVEMSVVTDIWRASRGDISVEEIARHHGFHGPNEGEISGRVWREDSTPLARVVAQYRDCGEERDPRRQDAERRSARSAVERELIEAARAWQRPIVKLVLKQVRERMPLRGVAKRSFLQAIDVARAAARQAGRHLAERGEISSPDDVFFLTFNELTGPRDFDLRPLVDLRRERQAHYEGLRLPTGWRGNPEPIAAQGPALDGFETGIAAETLTGVGVSAGVVEGVARVITNPDFFDVEPGEILVAATTDPSWCSIMFVSSALVVDIGGPLSHAAVVAREMEIPCVVNTVDGTKVIRTGDRVRVNGTNGTVEILSRAAEPTPSAED